MRMGAGTSTAPCAIHRSHSPAPTYTELHHVIPQAWQVAWQPPAPWPFEGASPDRPGVRLWDARTVALCRTGHGNVHYWLVAIMREIDQLARAAKAVPTSALLDRAYKQVKRDAHAEHRSVVSAEVAISEEAIRRYTDLAGGALATLIDAHLWGQI